MKKGNSTIHIVAMCTLLGLMVGWVPLLAAAQSTTFLVVKPESIEVPLGNQVLLNLEVTGGVNVNAFDIMVNYDIQHLSLVSWAHGDYLKSLSCLHEVNQPGVLELACTQIAQNAVNGDGILLELLFDSLSVGVGDVTITEAEFADEEGDKTLPERQHGEVTISGDPTYTPTRTATRTMTPTPTITWTRTSTPIFTATPANATAAQTLTGVVTQGRTVEANPTGMTDPVEQAEEGSLLTETSSGQIIQVTPQPVVEMAAGFPTDEVVGTTISEAETVTIDAKILVEEAAEEPSQQSLWNWVLWVVLVSAAAALVVMIIVFIKRRQNQEEDLLL